MVVGLAACEIIAVNYFTSKKEHSRQVAHWRATVLLVSQSQVRRLIKARMETHLVKPGLGHQTLTLRCCATATAQC